MSVGYIRIGAFSALNSAVETAVAAATRAQDMPYVPLAVNSVKFGLNIVLGMLLISWFHIGGGTRRRSICRRGYSWRVIWLRWRSGWGILCVGRVGGLIKGLGGNGGMERRREIR